jgi:hypothetical protein
MKEASGGARQGELFRADASGSGAAPLPPPLLREQLLAWQERVAAHQGPLFRREAGAAPAAQGMLFESAAAGAEAAARALDPLRLEAQSLAFWRWPSAPQRGAAIYLVLDRPAQLEAPLLLYVGETGRADQRWKGDHDCKGYLAAYGELLAKADLAPRLGIRFWGDVPAELRPRRALEQALIRHWLPPFNKETRDRWATPFTADPV